jgi:ABC-type multidrug transport system fused ATPase/permease subunit
MVGAQVAEAPPVGVRDIFREFWPDTRGFRRRMLLCLLLIPIPPLLAAAGIWLFKILVDDVLTPRNFALFPWLAAAFIAVTVVEGLFSFTDEYLSAWIAEKFVLVLRTRVFTHLHKLSLSFFDRHQLGDLLARLTGDVSAIEQLVLSGVNQALTYSFQIVFFAGALFVLDWRLALAALVATPFFLLLAKFFARRIKRASREQRRSSGMISAVAEESLHNVALVQAYGRQEHEASRFRRHGAKSFAAQMLAVKIEALLAPFTDILEVLGVLGVVGFGIHELSEGRVTLGGLIVFIGYLTQLYGPINGFGGLTNSIFAASAGAERVIELLQTEPGVGEPEQPVSVGRARGELACADVTFAYPGNERPALNRVAFRAAPGQTVAIVGASGAGKSSLARILLRLHDPDAGAVTLDGVDLRRIPLDELRDNIAVVLQETLVFDGTVAENIRWGRPDASDADVARAAAAADAHAFVSALPAGYQTRIGQRGMMLSGGQRQRIALARAMIRDAPVLLLDEPTTGLDAMSTQRVLEPLRRAMAGRTTVVISHNLLTVTDADQIVYLERGRVLGCGTHDELMMTTPGYAQLYRLHHPTSRPVRPGRPLQPVAHPGPVPAGPRPGPRPQVRRPASPAPARQYPRQDVPAPRPDAPAPRQYAPGRHAAPPPSPRPAQPAANRPVHNTPPPFNRPAHHTPPPMNRPPHNTPPPFNRPAHHTPPPNNGRPHPMAPPRADHPTPGPRADHSTLGPRDARPAPESRPDHTALAPPSVARPVHVMPVPAMAPPSHPLPLPHPIPADLAIPNPIPVHQQAPKPQANALPRPRPLPQPDPVPVPTPLPRRQLPVPTPQGQRLAPAPRPAGRHARGTTDA